MAEEYVEIVHVDKADLREYKELNPKMEEIVDNISKLEEKTKIHYEMGRLDWDPKLEKDHPIRVGGTLWEICVENRVENLIRMGYVNAQKDKSISFSDKDYVSR